MTGQAFAVVETVVADEVLVRIVAGKAGDARIVAVETAAVGKAIGLEADAGQATPSIADHGFPRAVALSAEI